MLAMKVTNFGPEIVPNFTLIARFQAKSQIPNPGLVALALALALYCRVSQSITDVTEYNRVLQSVTECYCRNPIDNESFSGPQ